MTKAAARVLADHAPTRDEAEIFEEVAASDRPLSQRLRALRVLRPFRWIHLATLLECYASARPEEAGSFEKELDYWLTRRRGGAVAPPTPLKDRIVACLDGLPEERQSFIRFVLRTSETP